MKFGLRHVTDSKEERRRKLEIDKLAQRDREQKVCGKVKKLASEGLQFLVCCLLGLAFCLVVNVSFK